MRKYKSIQGAARNIQGAVSGGGRSVHKVHPQCKHLELLSCTGWHKGFTKSQLCHKEVYLFTTTTTKPFVPSIWGRLHEPKENYARSGKWISFLHSFLSSNMPLLRPLASISCRITSIHVFFDLPALF